MPVAVPAARRARPSGTAAERLEAALAKYRSTVLRRHRVRNDDQLVALVDAAGFCFAFTAEAAYPVPGAFDHLATADEGRKWHWMWGWKDELAAAKRVYYGKLLVRKPTFVSLAMLPVFYAAHGRPGELDDHLDDVRSGRVSELGRRIVEHLAQHGETQTKRMRAQLGISSDEGRRQYAKAIEDLQRLMYVAHVRAVGDGREDYNYTYDLFVRRYPEAVKAAERITSAEATTRLVAGLLSLAGAVTPRQVERLFEWDAARAARAIGVLEARGALARVGARLVLPELLS